MPRDRVLAAPKLLALQQSIAEYGPPYSSLYDLVKRGTRQL